MVEFKWEKFKRPDFMGMKNFTSKFAIADKVRIKNYDVEFYVSRISFDPNNGVQYTGQDEQGEIIVGEEKYLELAEPYKSQIN